jgi:hypothetical protein
MTHANDTREHGSPIGGVEAEVDAVARLAVVIQTSRRVPPCLRLAIKVEDTDLGVEIQRPRHPDKRGHRVLTIVLEVEQPGVTVGPGPGTGTGTGTGGSADSRTGTTATTRMRRGSVMGMDWGRRRSATATITKALLMDGALLTDGRVILPVGGAVRENDDAIDKLAAS